MYVLKIKVTLYFLWNMFRWWSSETIALVTGANRGIGFEIARQLLLQGVTVILTSRGIEVGEAAAKVLRDTGLKVVFRQLDVTDPSSVKTCADWLQQNYGGLDILVRLILLPISPLATFGRTNSIL